MIHPYQPALIRRFMPGINPWPTARRTFSAVKEDRPNG
jgi:hypothetical protein